jgi:septum formation protein
MKLILASNSPRRKQLLLSAGYEFEVIASDFDEKEFSSDPILTAETFAVKKAQSVYDLVKDKEDVVVLGSDTVVFSDGVILGKPLNREDAKEMLKGLSNKTHTVITGYALVSKSGVIKGNSESKVTFNNLKEEIIEEYLNSGLYKGKAGSYGIQDPFPIVKSYQGSFTGIIGLPIEQVSSIIDKLIKHKN